MIIKSIAKHKINHTTPHYLVPQHHNQHQCLMATVRNSGSSKFVGILPNFELIYYSTCNAILQDRLVKHSYLPVSCMVCVSLKFRLQEINEEDNTVYQRGKSLHTRFTNRNFVWLFTEYSKMYYRKGLCLPGDFSGIFT